MERQTTSIDPRQRLKVGQSPAKFDRTEAPLSVFLIRRKPGGCSTRSDRESSIHSDEDTSSLHREVNTQLSIDDGWWTDKMKKRE